MAKLNKILKVTRTQYNTLVNGGTITQNGITYTYNANILYLIEDNDYDFSKRLTIKNTNTSNSYIDINYNDESDPYVLVSYLDASSYVKIRGSIIDIFEGGEIARFSPNNIQHYNGSSWSIFTFPRNYSGTLLSTGANQHFQRLPNQYNRIWDLEAGIYRLTYNGSINIYYSGSSSTTSVSFTTSQVKSPLLQVWDYGSTYKYWMLFFGYPPTICVGYTSSSSGTYTTKSVWGIKTSSKSFYNHFISMRCKLSNGDFYFYANINLITDSNSSFTAQSLIDYISNKGIFQYYLGSAAIDEDGDEFSDYIDYIGIDDSDMVCIASHSWSEPSTSTSLNFYASTSGHSGVFWYPVTFTDRVVSI